MHYEYQKSAPKCSEHATSRQKFRSFLEEEIIGPNAFSCGPLGFRSLGLQPAQTQNPNYIHANIMLKSIGNKNQRTGKAPQKAIVTKRVHHEQHHE